MSTPLVRTYERFPLARRIEHWVMMLSFTTLAITGLPQRFSASPISIAFVSMLGGIEVLRTIHHIAAIVMMLGTAWHLLVFGYLAYVRRTRLTMLPSLQDMKDGWQALMYNIGRAKTPPQMGRYTFEEKMEYWAFVWGAMIMGVTGFMMWNPITTARFLPGEVIPAAKAAHGGEALLAVLAINLVMLPFYLLALFIAGLGAVLFYAVNGWLAGRVYYEQVALRRMDPPEVKAWRRANAGVLWLTGMVIVFLGTIPVLNLIVPVLGVAAMVLLQLFFARTKTGVAMRASAFNPVAARLMGVPVDRMNLYTFAIGSALAGLAGVLLAPLLYASFDMGSVGLKAFAAACLGGFGSVPGAIVGGLVLGVAETLALGGEFPGKVTATDAWPYHSFVPSTMVASWYVASATSVASQPSAAGRRRQPRSGLAGSTLPKRKSLAARSRLTVSRMSRSASPRPNGSARVSAGRK